MGKSYLTDYVLCKCADVNKLTAATTRNKRRKERDGIDKYFLTYDQFEEERENLILIRKMYGAYYGFWADHVNVEEDLVVELYYKDYLSMKKEGYPVIGIYIWTSQNKYRRNLLKNRYTNKSDLLTREISDVFNNILHKIMLKLGLFDFNICNCYNEDSKNTIVRIVGSKGKRDDSC